MAVVQCNYFDKRLRSQIGLGNMRVSRGDFACALLSLHGTYRSKVSKFLEYLSSLLKVSARFSFPIAGNLSYRLRSGNVYDGVLREESDLFASSIAVLVAKKKYKHRHVFTLSERQVITSNGRRPDFLATNGNDYSLFESKGSFTYGRTISEGTVRDGIDQLNAVSAVILDNGEVVSNFKEKVVVATGLSENNRYSRQEVKCDIYDPDNLKSEQIDFSITEALNDYYSFVRKIVDFEGEKQKKEFGSDISVVFSTIEVKGMPIEIGLLEELYRTGFESYKDVNKVLKNLKKRKYKSPMSGERYFLKYLNSDGVYLRIAYENVRNPQEDLG